MVSAAYRIMGLYYNDVQPCRKRGLSKLINSLDFILNMIIEFQYEPDAHLSENIAVSSRCLMLKYIFSSSVANYYTCNLIIILLQIIRLLLLLTIFLDQTFIEHLVAIQNCRNFGYQGRQRSIIGTVSFNHRLVVLIDIISMNRQDNSVVNKSIRFPDPNLCNYVILLFYIMIGIYYISS